MRGSSPSRNDAPYTGPERRRNAYRSSFNWTYRSNQHWAQWAKDEGHKLAVLERMAERAFKKGNRIDEYRALASACTLMRRELEVSRRYIAEETAPWFDGSAFERRHLGVDDWELEVGR